MNELDQDPIMISSIRTLKGDRYALGNILQRKRLAATGMQDAIVFAERADWLTVREEAVALMCAQLNDAPGQSSWVEHELFFPSCQVTNGSLVGTAVQTLRYFAGCWQQRTTTYVELASDCRLVLAKERHLA
jgi:hypothetical protein